MMTVERIHIGWKFWVQWVLANTCGAAVGGLVGFMVISVSAIVGRVGPGTAGWPAGLAVCWAVVAAMQGLVLRRHISLAGWWVLASSLGWTMVWVAGFAVTLAVGEHKFWMMWGPLLNPVVAAAHGAVGGAMQWLVLRRQISRAGWWVLASTVGWLVAFVVGAAVGGALVPDDWPMLFPALVVLSAPTTGIVLVWLLRQPASEA
jgi:hypothetical protein